MGCQPWQLAHRTTPAATHTRVRHASERGHDTRSNGVQDKVGGSCALAKGRTELGNLEAKGWNETLFSIRIFAFPFFFLLAAWGCLSLGFRGRWAPGLHPSCFKA